MGDPAVLRLQGYSYAYPKAAEFVLKEVSLELFAGQCHGLTGPTGCGKTTLLMAVRGLLPPGRQTGELVINAGRKADAAVGIVLQNPLTQLLRVGLGAEVAFGLENHCVPPQRMAERVRRALGDVGLQRPLDTPVTRLSMGQQYRVCLAGALAMGPALVLMDEPTAQLDPQGLHQLMRIIHNLKTDGRAVLICDHRPDLLATIIDRCWRLAPDGRLHADRTAQIEKKNHEGDLAIHPLLVQDGIGSCDAPVTPGHYRPGAPEATVLRVQELAMSNQKNDSQRPLLTFSAARGERLAICGPNGSGKTTLVNCLTGLARPCAGSVEICHAAPEPRNLRGRVGVLFQNPGRQLFDTSVFEEVAFAAKRLRKAEDPVEEHVTALLTLLDLMPLAGMPPHALSYGQKHLVGLAAVLSGEPQVLILDDPMAGLDGDKLRKVMDVLVHLSETRGTTILWTSHDPDLLNGWAHRTIRLESDPASRPIDAPVDGRILAHREIASGGRTPTPLHTGTALALSILLSMTAFATRSPALLAVLTGINLLVLLLRCPHPLTVLRRSARLFLWQAALIVLLYGLRFGWQNGWSAGLQVAWQLFLAFWPGIVLLASTTSSQTTRALSRVLPHQTAFVVSACLHFLPTLLSEANHIRLAQIFRGARLLKRDLKKPRYWPDWLHCLLVPTLVRALSLASEIALAASARDFGIHRQRTQWPGDAP
jgi:energy-coupling factor transporter ATP-binding protein EcfA2